MEFHLEMLEKNEEGKGFLSVILHHTGSVLASFVCQLGVGCGFL